MLRLLLTLTLMHALALPSWAETTVPSGDELLQEAFDRRFNFDVVQVVELYARSSVGEIRRILEMAIKRVDGSLHGLGHFTQPDELRGMRLLMIEKFDRSDEFFLYIPTQRTVRRISSAQRADAFMGTDLSYEDFERRYVSDYDISMAGVAKIQGEEVFAIRAEPRYESGHSHAIYYVAKSDQAILEVHFFRPNRDEPIKVQRMPRAKMISLESHIVPTVIWVENKLRGTTTEVRFSQIRINPDLDDSLFSRSALEVGRAIPYLTH